MHSESDGQESVHDGVVDEVRSRDDRHHARRPDSLDLRNYYLFKFEQILETHTTWVVCQSFEFVQNKSWNWK